MCMSLGLCLNNDQSIAFVVVIFQISNGNFHYYMKIILKLRDSIMNYANHLIRNLSVSIYDNIIP